MYLVMRRCLAARSSEICVILKRAARGFLREKPSSFCAPPFPMCSCTYVVLGARWKGERDELFRAHKRQRLAAGSPGVAAGGAVVGATWDEQEAV